MCRRCSRRGPGLCDECHLATGSAREWTDHGTDYECPDCGGPTSGEGAVCYQCRGGDR